MKSKLKGCLLFSTLFCLALSMTACSPETPPDSEKLPGDETTNVFSTYKYADFANENWDAKTISYQFLSDYEDGSNYRICANLYSDGSVASWQGVTLNSDDGMWVNEEYHIRWDFYGYWTSSKEDVVKTLNIHITKSEDENGNAEYLDYECNDFMEANVFELPEYACFSFGKTFNDGKGANTKRAVYCDGTVHYQTLKLFYESWHSDNFANV